MNQKLIDNILMLDHVLTSLNLPPVRENPIFEVDDLSDENFLRIFLKDRKLISLVFEFSESGIDVHLDDFSEVFSWGSSFLEENKNTVSVLLKNILVCKIEVLSWDNKIKVFLFRDFEKDVVLHKIRVIESVLINPFKKDRKLFPPIIKSTLEV
jgi:hypothetical protein